jgi:uncharacterized membrane protein HdeD (DUF308 family)
MAVPEMSTQSGLHLVGVEELRRRWGWFVALGILLMALGVVAVGAATLFTIASMIVFGWLLVIGGVLQTLHSISCKDWGGFFIDLLAGILYLVVGLLIVSHPAAAAIELTLLIAVLLIFSGGFRIAVAIAARFHHRLWLLLHGVVNLLLGFVIWQDWPISGTWVIGLFIGVDMIFNGWSLVALGLAARRFTGINASS